MMEIFPIIDISNCSTNKIESIAHFDHKDVLKVMSKLKTSSAAGPDGSCTNCF